MPLFVWCSGFLFAYTDQTRRYSFRQFAGKRAKKLLLPYVILSVVGIAPKVMFSSVLNDSLSFDIVSLIRAFLIPRENIWGHFWFLPMIYLLGVMGFIVDKYFFITKYKNILLLLILIGLLVVSNSETEAGKWLGLNDILHYGWIYILGIFVAQTGISVLQQLSGNQKLLYASGGMLISIMLYGSDALIPFSLLVKDSIDVLMIGSMLSFGMLISRKVRIARECLIAQTYQLFILSWPCQLIIEILTERIFHLPWWAIMTSVFLLRDVNSDNANRVS